MRTSFLIATLFIVTAAQAAITGTLMTPDGVAIAGGRVAAFPFLTSDERRSAILTGREPVALVTTTSDARGRFVLEIPADNAVVSLRIDGAGRAPHQVATARNQELGALRLRAARPGRGRVIAGGKPVGGAMVVVSGSFHQVVRTDRDGSYEIPDTVGVHLAVLHSDYAIAEAASTPESETGALDHQLDRGISLEGTVVTEDGAPVAGATIVLGDWPLAQSGEDGSFTIPHAPRDWKVLAAYAGELAAWQRFAGAGDQQLRVSRAPMIQGRITDAKSGNPIGGALVATAPPIAGDRVRSPAAITDVKGTFELPTVPGERMILVSHPLYLGEMSQVSIGQGERKSVDIRVNPLSLVTGSVVDEEKKPVAGASIVVESADASAAQRNALRAVAHTAPDGSFTARYFSLDPDIRIRASSPHGPSAVSETFARTPGDVRRGVTIVIPVGFALKGRVTDSEGKPLEGVKVSAVESDETAALRGMRPLVDPNAAGVFSASDGTFDLRVTEGLFDFSFTRDGYAPKRVFAQKVSAETLPQLEVSLDRAVAISGRVMRSGVGVAGVGVSAGSAHAITDAAGKFSLGGLSRGPVSVFIQKSDEFIQESRLLEAPKDDLVFEVAAGRRVAGRVIDRKSGLPIASFTAGISWSVGIPGGGSRGTTHTQPFDAADGAFEFENVPAGAITVVANAPGYASASLDITADDAGDLTRLQLELDQAIRIMGRVTDPDGNPIDGVYVSADRRQVIRRQISSPSSTTNANGEYSLDGVNPSAGMLTFHREGFLQLTKQIDEPGSAREIRIDVQLSRGDQFRGSVVAMSGTPVDDALVTVFGTGISESTRTDGGGRFEITGLPAGKYTIRVRKPGVPARTLHEVPVSGQTPLRIVMNEGGTITGRIRGLAASELPLVTVSAAGSDAYTDGAVGADGEYRLDGAPLGRVTVFASVRTQMMERSSDRHEIDISANRITTLDLTFRQGATVRGRVTRGGEPMAAASVTFSGDGNHLSATTANDGTYEISHLEEGPYVVIVSAGPRRDFRTHYVVSESATLDIPFPAGYVRGRVLDASTGEPLSNVQLGLQKRQAPAYAVPSPVVSDSRGAFSIEAVPPGTYVLTGRSDDFAAEAYEVSVGTTGLDGVEVRMKRSSETSLEILDGRTGQRLQARVSVYDTRGNLLHDSFGPAGGLMQLPLATGSYTAQVSAHGYAARIVTITSPSSQRVTLSPGGTLDIRAAHSGRMTVRLLDGSGQPYPRQASMHVFSHGAGRLHNIAPGTYTVEVLEDDGSVSASRQVTVQEGGITQLDI